MRRYQPFLHRSWKYLKIRPLLIIAVLISVCACLDAQNHAQSRTDQNRALRSVTIYRDDWGVPHVYANREENGFYGLGYAQAEDRLEGILRHFLAVRGESASAFGPEAVKADLRSLQWMHLEEAHSGFQQLEPQLQKDYRYFIAGVKRYMREHPREVPAWAPPLDPTLPMAVLNSALWGVNEIEGVEDCTRGGVSVALENQADPGALGGLSAASNEWVVMPSRTADHVVIHLEDSHVPFEGEVRAFEFRLHAGTLDLGGFSADGLVLPVAAHNRNVAWAMTAGGPDVADCYAVDVDHNNPRRYLFDGEWQEMTTRRVTIQVKGGAPITKEFEYTHHNGVLSPVVARQGDTAYVVSSAYMGQAGLIHKQLYRMDLSKNMAEFRQAMSILGMFKQNIMAGSSDGHSLYVRAGRVPIRPLGYDWRKSVPGNTSATAWRGIYPLDDLVVVEDPAAGYMTNDNVAPDMMTEEKSVIAERYPFEVFFDLPGFTNARGRRVVQVLSRASSFSKTDALELALDEKWEGTEVWVEALRQAMNWHSQDIEAKPTELQHFANRILHFDGFARKESIGALDYLYWRTAVGDDPANSGQLAQAIENHKEISPAQEIALIEGLERALRTLTTDHGATEASLGDVYRIGRGGQSWPIGGVKFQAGGEEITTIRAMQAGPPDSHGLRWVFAGQRQPCLTIFSNPIQSFTSAPFGQSDHPQSPHYSDQARLLSERRLKPTYFNQRELMKHVESKIILRVEPEGDARRGSLRK
jgi:acyl-homoserine-lactone acylase